MIIYYAGLMSISDDIYEAAKIDGCGFWNTLFRITIPNLSGTTNTLILLGIVGSLKTFDIVIQTTGGGPGRSTEFPEHLPVTRPACSSSTAVCPRPSA